MMTYVDSLGTCENLCESRLYGAIDIGFAIGDKSCEVVPSGTAGDSPQVREISLTFTSCCNKDY